MTDQYQLVSTSEGQNNITYIQFLQPSQQNILYCKDEADEENDEFYDENQTEEIIEGSYVEDEPIASTVEILESIVVGRKKKNSYTTHVKKLVQVKGK